MWIVKKTYAILLRLIQFLLGIDFAKKFDTYLRFHKKLNLIKPQTLSEKVTYIELHEQSYKAVMCTDKYAVREYLQQKELGELLIPLVGGPWDSVEQIDFSLLPSKYVIKATHGCKMNFIVNNNQELDITKCKSTLMKWLNVTYGSYSIEPHYEKIPHRLYAEKFLDDIDQLIDYKFHCFNGEPIFVLTCSNRQSNGDAPMKVTLDLFDMEWKPLYGIMGTGSEVAGKGAVPRPNCLKEMISIARELSKEFKFVRIDLYEYHNKVLFGEMTFSPGCCVFPYFSNEFDLEMGKLLKL